MEHATDKLITAINKILGCDAVSADYENFNIEVEEAEDDSYIICCDDTDEMYNVLMSMIDGMRLYKSIQERKGAE